jgi:hypothetical protein
VELVDVAKSPPQALTHFPSPPADHAVYRGSMQPIPAVSVPHRRLHVIAFGVVLAAAIAVFIAVRPMTRCPDHAPRIDASIVEHEDHLWRTPGLVPLVKLQPTVVNPTKGLHGFQVDSITDATTGKEIPLDTVTVTWGSTGERVPVKQ